MNGCQKIKLQSLSFTSVSIKKTANVQIISIFISAHGYSEHSSAYYRVVNRVLALGGAVISHDHYAHGRSGPHQADSVHRCQIYR